MFLKLRVYSENLIWLKHLRFSTIGAVQSICFFPHRVATAPQAASPSSGSLGFGRCVRAEQKEVAAVVSPRSALAGSAVFQKKRKNGSRMFRKLVFSKHVRISTLFLFYSVSVPFLFLCIPCLFCFRCVVASIGNSKLSR